MLISRKFKSCSRPFILKFSKRTQEFFVVFVHDWNFLFGDYFFDGKGIMDRKEACSSK